MKLIQYTTPVSNPLNEIREWLREPLLGGLGELGDRVRSQFAGPNVEVYEDATHYHARVEVPGVKKEEIDLKLDPERGVLLKVERKVVRNGSENTERFARQFSLPSDAQTDKVSAKLEDGVLTISVPKVPKQEPVKIEIA